MDPDGEGGRRRDLGAFLRGQRRLADLSLRQLSQLTNVSNAYLSQVERGLHEPSVRVLRALAEALDISSETLLAEAGFLEEQTEEGEGDAVPSRVERAILTDPGLSPAQKEALISVYRSYLSTDESA